MTRSTVPASALPPHQPNLDNGAPPLPNQNRE